MLRSGTSRRIQLEEIPTNIDFFAKQNTTGSNVVKPTKNHSTDALPSIKCKALSSYHPIYFRREVYRESTADRACILKLYNASELTILR